jgi:hypothetical protein
MANDDDDNSDDDSSNNNNKNSVQFTHYNACQWWWPITDQHFKYTINTKEVKKK